MVRVAGLAGQVREGIALKSPDGRTPEQQLEQLLREVERLQEDQQKSLSALMALLNKEGIESITRDALTKDEKIWLEDHFQEQVFPVLTPLSIDPAHPFPFIPNLGFSMALQLAPPQERRGDERAAAPAGGAASASSACRTARTHVRFIPLEEAVGLFIGKLFPGLRGQGLRHVPDHPRQRYRGRGRIRGSRPPVRDRAEAPAARLGDPHRVRQPDAGRIARFRRRRAWRRRPTASAC